MENSFCLPLRRLVRVRGKNSADPPPAIGSEYKDELRTILRLLGGAFIVVVVVFCGLTGRQYQFHKKIFFVLASKRIGFILKTRSIPRLPGASMFYPLCANYTPSAAAWSIALSDCLKAICAILRTIGMRQSGMWKGLFFSARHGSQAAQEGRFRDRVVVADIVGAMFAAAARGRECVCKPFLDKVLRYELVGGQFSGQPCFGQRCFGRRVLGQSRAAGNVGQRAMGWVWQGT